MKQKISYFCSAIAVLAAVITITAGVVSAAVRTSDHYQMIMDVVSAGGITFESSTHYQIDPTAGQPVEPGISESPGYKIEGGYQPDEGGETNPPTVEVTSPDASGVTLEAGTTFEVTWIATDESGISNIWIRYSTGDAYPWIDVSTNESNDGSYVWTVPNTISTTCKISIEATDTTGLKSSDASNNNFEIKPAQFSLISGGCSYTNNPAPHSNYPDTSPPSKLTDGALAPFTYPYYDHTELVYWYSGIQSPPIEVDIDLGSSRNISAVRFHYLIDSEGGISYPAGLAVYGSNDNSNWTALDSFIQGTDWANSPNPSLQWSNTLKVSGTYRYVKFSFSSSDIMLDEVQVYTGEITHTVVTVEAPDGGEIWEINSTHNITWTATSDVDVDHVNIDYTTDEGSSWINIISDAANNSLYTNWTSSIPSDKYKIRIQAVDIAGNIATDESDSDFTFYKIGNALGCVLWNRLDSTASAENSPIGPNGTVEGSIDYAPVKFNNGAQADAASEYIHFVDGDALLDKTKGCIEFWMKPQFGMSGGSSSNGDVWSGGWNMMMDNRPDGYQHMEIMAWPPGYGNGMSFMYDYNAGQNVYLGSNFSWITGEVMHIACVWSSAGDIPGGHKLAIYINGSLEGYYDGALTTSFSMSDFSICGSGSGSYPGYTYMDNIKVWNYAKTDFSDRLYEGFEANLPTVEVTSPDASGVTLEAGTTFEVTWTATDESGISNIWIRYSTGDAYPWIDVSTNESNDGSYVWTVPTVESITCKISIKATDTTGLKSYDVSNNDFEIIAASLSLPVVYVSPEGSDSSGNGTLSNPFRTIYKGLYNTAPGGEVRMMGGVYTETGDYNIYWPSGKGTTLKRAAEATEPATIDAKGTEKGITVSGDWMVTIEGITIQNCYLNGYSGAGIYAGGSGSLTLHLKDVVMQYCTAENSSGTGGAIYASSGYLIMENCQFIGNQGNYGGAIAGSNLFGYAYNSIFRQNIAANCGGAIHDDSATSVWEVVNCDFYNNKATDGSGAVVYNILSLNSVNCIYWANIGYSYGVVFSQIITSNTQYYSDIQDNGWNDDYGVALVATNSISSEPLFISTSDPYDLHMLPTSECINSGTFEGATTIDATGVTRPQPSDDPYANYDMGCYEQAATPPVVTVEAPNGGEIWEANTLHYITWKATDESGISNIWIRYSTGDAYPWIDISTNEANDGSYAWTVPSTISSACRISIEATDGEGMMSYDESNNNFEIIPERNRVHNITQATDYLTIQEAMDSANEGDVISLEAWTYKGTGNYDIEWSGPDFVTLKGLGAGLSTIDAQNAGEGIIIGTYSYYINASIEGIAIRNGYASGYTYGGGIFVSIYGLCSLTNVSINNCAAEYGGGIYIDSVGTLQLTSVEVSHCTAEGSGGDWRGGAIYLGSGKIKMDKCRFIGNSAGSNGYGGVIAMTYSSSSINAVNCIFKDNSADYGAVVEGPTTSGGTVNVTNCAFVNNSAPSGGGIEDYMKTWADKNCIYLNNYANASQKCFSSTTNVYINYSDLQPDGWGDPQDYGTINISNSISLDPGFVDPASDLHLASGSPCIDSGSSTGAPSTDADGKARPHGLGFDIGPYEFQGPSVILYQPNGGSAYYSGSDVTIIWAATDESGLQAIQPITIRYSSDEGITWILITNESNTGVYTWETPVIESSQCLVSIEVTNSSSVSNYDVSNSTFTLSSLAIVYVDPIGGSDSNTGTIESPFLTIQKGLDTVIQGGEIKLFSGTYAGAGNKNIIWPNKTGITLHPSDESSVCTIDAENSGRGISITDNVSANIERLTFTNGNIAADGSGIYCNNGTYTQSTITLKSVSISDCRFTNNYSVGWGGAVYIRGYDSYVTNCIFKHNSSDYAGGSGPGGLMIESGFYPPSLPSVAGKCSATVTNCLFYKNIGGWGGGASLYLNKNAIVESCTFVSNEADYPGDYGDGGGLYTGSKPSGFNVTVNNSIFWGNTAYSEAPQIYDESNGGKTKVTYSDVQGGVSGVAGQVYLQAGTTEADPNFVSYDETSPDFLRLGSGSPCIDKGTPNGAPSNDLAGNFRPKGLGYDMGAYEFQGPTVRVTYPNGGEEFAPLTPLTITWTASDETSPVTGVNLYYSYNGGVSWIAVATNETGTSFIWTTPDIASDQFLISADAVNGNSIWNNDVSDNTFAIPLHIVFIAPAPIGSNITGTGKFEAPLRTLQKGLNSCAASGEVRMFAGIYTLEASEFVLSSDGNYNMAKWPNRDNITLKPSDETFICTIDAQGSGRVIVVPYPVNVTIEGITFKGGSVPYGQAGGGICMSSLTSEGVLQVKDCTFNSCNANVGGAIFSTWVSVEVEDSFFILNTAHDGGALAVGGIILTLTNCTFESNHAWYGGAVRGPDDNSGKIIVENCDFNQNLAWYMGGNYGGVAYMGNWVVNNSRFTGNSTGLGGVASGCKWQVSHSIFKNNHVNEYGGVFFRTSVSAEACTFEANYAGQYGGVAGDYYNPGYTHDFVNCIFLNNCSFVKGGVCFSLPWNVVNCTFYGNTSEVGGVVYDDQNLPWTVKNSVFYGNNATTDEVFSNQFGPHTATYSNIQANGFIAGTGNISSEPKLVSPASGDLRLGGGSPCIDSATFEGAPSVDLAGSSRPRGFGFDMGALEFQGTSITVIRPNGGEPVTAESSYKIIFNVSPDATDINIRVSTDEGNTWSLITDEGTYSGISTYEWTPSSSFVSSECLISVEVYGNSIWNYDASDATFEIILPPQLPSIEVWVSTTGFDDTGNGTINKPYRTIAFALTKVTTGGAVKAFGGTYNEHDISWPGFNNITLKASLETSPVTIDAGGVSGQRGILVASTVNMTLEGLTVQGGKVTGPGGGIYITAANTKLWLTNMTFQYCTIEGGFNYGAAVFCADNTVDVNVNNSIFQKNSVFHAGGCGAYGTWNVTNSIFRNNYSQNSAPVSESGLWKVNNCTIEGNYAVAGGGVAMRGTWEAMNCVFMNNKGGNAGIAHTVTFTATNCVFSSNEALSAQGGVFYIGTGGNWNFTNCTFFRNKSYGNGGIAHTDDSSSTFSAKNSVFWYNSIPLFDGSPTINITYSDVQDNDFQAGTGNISLEPVFVSTVEPRDLRLGAGSPCIDRASATGAPTTDAIGNARPHGLGYDMGAYEFQGPSVLVLKPNGSEQAIVGTIYKITYQVSPDADYIYVRLSTDEGTHWGLPLTQEAGTHTGICTYEWTVPNLVSSECLISVEARHNSIWNIDKSDATFEIIPDAIPPVVTVEAPNGGEILYLGQKYNIRWAATDNAGLGGTPITLSYTTDEGASWISIASNLANSGSYLWAVPSIITSEYLVSVEAKDTMNNVGMDISDSTFEVVQLSLIYIAPSPTGSDESGTGTIEAPFRTIQKALDNVAAGGVIMAFSGIYNEHNIAWPDKNYITLQASDETSICTLDAGKLGRCIVSTYEVNLTIQGFTLQNGRSVNGSGIYLQGGSSLWLERDIVKNCSTDAVTAGGAVSAQGSYVYVNNSTFSGNYAWWGGIADQGNWTVTNSTFSGNRADHGGVAWLGEWNVTNSIFSGNKADSDGGVACNSIWRVTNSTFYNNSASAYYGNVTYGCQAFFRNSIFVNASTYTFSSTTGTIEYCALCNNDSYSQTNIGNIYKTAQFVSTLEGNFRLKGGSPGIDYGTSEGAPTQDAVGNYRPHGRGYDMGAYEFQGPSVLVTYPNGGEKLYASTEVTITWQTSDEAGLRVSPLPITIRYSTNEGLAWKLITQEISDTGSYTWEIPYMKGTKKAMISIEAVNSSGVWNCDASDAVFTIYLPLVPPTRVSSEALPRTSSPPPDKVRITWNASTNEGVEGYYVYRGLTYETYEEEPISPLVVTLSYDDTLVEAGTDYYYAVTTYGSGSESVYSRVTSAPLLIMTRTSAVDSPVSGGYTGGAHDAVPGATVKFTMLYENIGFAPAASIIINDRIPSNTEYKVGSATGEAAYSIRFSNNGGPNWNYTPTVTSVDPLVTNISWEVQNTSSGHSGFCTYEVVIK